jgi:hypothetical protein
MSRVQAAVHQRELELDSKSDTARMPRSNRPGTPARHVVHQQAGEALHLHPGLVLEDLADHGHAFVDGEQRGLARIARATATTTAGTA